MRVISKSAELLPVESVKETEFDPELKLFIEEIQNKNEPVVTPEVTPEVTITEMSYTIVSGDVLWKIAVKYSW